MNPMDMAGQITEHHGCRICGGDLETILDFGSQYLQGCFVKPGVSDPPRMPFPMELTRCTTRGCGLVQLRHTLTGALLYDVYWYRSRINNTMRDHLAWLAATAAELWSGGPGRVLDIGCNDGTLLGQFDGWQRWGVEPSSAADEVGSDVTVVRDFFPTENPQLRDGTFDVVTSIAMFYDVDDPVTFARRVGRLLSPDGVWVVEVAYLPAMLDANAYDAVCHEHLAYYSLTTLRLVLQKAGLCVVQVRMNTINGGSMCCFITRAGERDDLLDGSVEETIRREADLGLSESGTYAAFADRVAKHRQELRNLLVSLRDQGCVVHVYGASTKGNTLLQYCGVDRTLVRHAAERNPDKVGARTLGTDIEIISEEESRQARPDFYLVLPWHFRDEILARESATLLAGCKMIFPLPSLETVGRGAA